MRFETNVCAEACSALRSLVGPVRAESGCVETRIQKDAEKGCSVNWVEEWQSIQHFERHLRSPSFRKILAIIEMASEKPVVEIDDVSSRRGFELVEEILGVRPNDGGQGECCSNV